MKNSPVPVPPNLMNGSISSIDEYMMLKAFQVSLETDDPKAVYHPTSGVGAIIADKTAIISTSANRIVPRLQGKVNIVEPNATERYFYIEHAERCAIFEAVNAGRTVEGATMYCTRFPCADCARAISFVKISRLVVPNGFSNESKWIEAQRAALSILRKSGVTIRYFDPR